MPQSTGKFIYLCYRTAQLEWILLLFILRHCLTGNKHNVFKGSDYKQKDSKHSYPLSESPISVCNRLCSLHLTHLHLHILSSEWTPDQTSTAWQDISHTLCYSKDLTYLEHSLSPLKQHKPTALVVLTLQKKIFCTADTGSIRTPGTSLQLHLRSMRSVRSLSD